MSKKQIKHVYGATKDGKEVNPGENLQAAHDLLKMDANPIIQKCIDTLSEVEHPEANDCISQLMYLRTIIKPIIREK